VAGVVFGYFVVLPAATKFLLNFNNDQFNIQIRAKDYYSFFTLTLAVMGLIFQLPIGILAVTRLGIVSPEQLTENRRYAYVILLIVAMLLPGTDPVTMLIEAVPLILLYEASVVLAKMFGRPPESAADREITVSEPPPSGAA
jgi:sec-independent protein translocase protein TatC